MPSVQNHVQFLGRAKNELASYAMLVFVCEFLRGSAIELGACV